MSKYNYDYALKYIKKLSVEELSSLSEEADVVYHEKMNSLDCAQNIPRSAKAIPVTATQISSIMGNLMFETGKNQEAEKETAMHTEEQRVKDYLIESLDQETSRKRNRLEKAFGVSYERPTTLGEVREYVKNGWVQVAEGLKDETDDWEVYNPGSVIQFKNPDRKKDKAGFNAAIKTMTAAQSDVMDEIVVKGPEAGLEALNAFKAQTFQ